jgi:hypothetical protein
MKLRLILPFFLACISLSLFAQPEIVSITYDGDVAILTRNEPPDPDIIYYWQGASCGVLMNHSGSTTFASSDGTYYLREYYSSSGVWASSCASTVVIFPDVTPPVLSDVTTGTIDEGIPIAATSNEDGMVYLVPDGTAGDVGAINAAKVSEAASTENIPVSLVTTGVAQGDYIVFAVDLSDNVSAPSAVITIADLTAPVLSDVTAGPIEAGTDINATSNEDGAVVLVPDGTAPNHTDIGAAMVSNAPAVANVASTLSTDGLPEGDYIVYAIDEADNISAASPAITISWATYIDLNNANPNQVQLYPVNVVDILHIKANIQVSSVKVYSLNGAQVIHINTPVDQVDMSSLNAGVYIVSIQLQDNTVFSGKITKR